MLSWVRGPTRLDVEGSVASSVFPVSASMSSLSDDQTAASLSVDDPVVDIQFLITAERMIVGGVTVGASDYTADGALRSMRVLPLDDGARR